LHDDDIFLSFTARAKVQELLDDGSISPKERDDFLIAARAFHVQGTLYALKWLPIHDPILKQAGVLTVLLKSKFSFHCVVWLVDRFKSYLHLTSMNMLETTFAPYQLLKLDLFCFVV